MTKQEAIWAASKLLCNIYHDDSGGDFEKIKAQAQIITAEADKNVDYLCSSLDEIIKNAEDHAYFAGSENTREKLINKACKWWEVELIFPSMTPGEIKLYKSKVRRFRKDMEDET